MLIVSIEQAKEGMVLAVAVTHPDQPDQDLLKPGFRLHADIIGRLRQMGVETLYVDYPDLADIDHQLAPLLSPARQEIYRQIRDTIAAVQKTAKPTVSFPDYYASTRELVITLMSQGQHCVYLDQMSGRLGTHAVAHATATAHLSLMLGLRLEQYLIQQRSRLPVGHAKEVINLGVGAMLHDIGLARLPEPVRKFSRLAPPEDPALLAEWRTHPEVGYEMVKGGVEATAAAAVLHHHQSYDGTGFPVPPAKPGDNEPRNQGDRIHVFSRIIAAADLYDRLTAGPDGQRRPNVEILHLMRTQFKELLDPQVLTAFPAVVPPFPPGVKVTLSDGTPAVTVGMNPDRPYQPIVKRIEEVDHTLRVIGDPVDLSATAGLKIDRVADLDVEGLVPPLPEPRTRKKPPEPVPA